jgi:hypothetical protein
MLHDAEAKSILLDNKCVADAVLGWGVPNGIINVKMYLGRMSEIGNTWIFLRRSAAFVKTENQLIH